MDVLQFHCGVCECAELVYLPDILSVHTHQHRRESELLVLSIQRYVPNRNLLAASPHLTCSLLPPRSCLQIVCYILFPPPPLSFFFLICLLFPILSYSSYQRMYWPKPYHIVQEISVADQKDERRLRRIRRGKFIRDKLKIKQLLRKRKSTIYHFLFRVRIMLTYLPLDTGYAFSQAEGGSDLFYSLGMAPIPSLPDTPLLPSSSRVEYLGGQ